MAIKTVTTIKIELERTDIGALIEAIDTHYNYTDGTDDWKHTNNRLEKLKERFGKLLTNEKKICRICENEYDAFKNDDDICMSCEPQ